VRIDYFAIMLATVLVCTAQPARAWKPCTNGSSGACTPSFFPTASPGVRHHSFYGILRMFGYGNKSGGISLVDHGGQMQEFYLTGPGTVMVDGHYFYCSGIRRGFNFQCGGWPKSITVGVTPVVVAYFWTTRYGKPVRVVDRIRKIS